MRRRWWPLCVIVILSGVISLRGLADSRDDLVQRAVSDDAQIADKAIAELRAMGPEGLDRFIAGHSDLIQLKTTILDFGPAAEDPQLKRVCRALDAIAMQKDAHASRLYWHTDLERAKAQATKEGKPILSLRLLGTLETELSCANSRFFRTTLYPNVEVSNRLRENFVLHWQSVRPVPKITIDFGDGRVIERTITGNSIHYALDSEGRVLDGLPGLYGPQAFARWLDEMETLARSQAKQTNDDHRAEALRAFHVKRSEETESAWRADISAIQTSTTEMTSVWTTDVLRPEELSDQQWASLAARHAKDAQLDASAQFLIRSHHRPTARDAARIAVSKFAVEDPMVNILANLQRSIAEDTVRNEYVLHQQLRSWFVQATAPLALDELNRRVYAELFLTPDSDPWLGLVREDVYSALPGNGIRQK